MQIANHLQSGTAVKISSQHTFHSAPINPIPPHLTILTRDFPALKIPNLQASGQQFESHSRNRLPSATQWLQHSPGQLTQTAYQGQHAYQTHVCLARLPD